MWAHRDIAYIDENKLTIATCKNMDESHNMDSDKRSQNQLYCMILYLKFTK